MRARIRAIFLVTSLLGFPILSKGDTRLAQYLDLNSLPALDWHLFVKDGVSTPLRVFAEAVVIDLKKTGAVDLICSGVLLTPSVALSAGHCVAHGYSPVRVSVTPDHAIAPDLGGLPYQSAPQPNGAPPLQSVGVTNYESMNAAGIDEGWLDGQDLMVVFLKSPIKAPPTPPTIPRLDNIASAEVVRVVGFGDNGQRGFGQRLMADVPVAVPRCNPHASTGPDALCAAGAELLARRKDGKYDTCPGDSGGPVYIRGKGGTYYLVGITSRPPTPSAACGGGTFVTLLDGNRLSWIRSKTSISLPTVELEPEAPPACEQAVSPGCF